MAHFPVELQSKTMLFGIANAIYRVDTERKGSVFMRVARSNYHNDQRTVVLVDAARFLTAWRADCGPAQMGVIRTVVARINRAFGRTVPGCNEWLPHLSLEAWKLDSKFQWAADGFAHGAENPVPLARVGLSRRTHGYVAFTNGITRTLWLLANGAISFPIECDASSAEAFSRAVGVDWAQPMTVQNLLGDLNGFGINSKPELHLAATN
jgi:hypothetical protein